MNASRFEIRDRFYLDEKPFKIISGSVHYFRVVPEYWRDRLEKLRLLGANDRAQIFLDRRPFLTLYDRELEREYEIPGPDRSFAQLDILVENMGRVNYGPKLEEQRKGIRGSVLLNGHGHAGWKIYPLEIDASMLEKLDFTKEYQKGTPAFYRIVFSIEKPGDTFLDLSGWGKGCALLNGFNLGRFWEKGPQKRVVPRRRQRTERRPCSQ